MPACFLLGIKGIFSPMCHRSELVADFLDEPVPTTSPTNTIGKLDSLSFSIFSKGSSIVFLSIANA